MEIKSRTKLVKPPIKPKKIVDLDGIPEPKRRPLEETKDNPWADDQPQYHVDVGGVQNFLKFRASQVLLPESAPQTSELSDRVLKTIDKLDQVRKVTTEYQ
jgi:hypothetical protein